jgi:hypothetical protein
MLHATGHSVWAEATHPPQWNRSWAFLLRQCGATPIEREYLASKGGVHAEAEARCGGDTCRCDIGDGCGFP